MAKDQRGATPLKQGAFLASYVATASITKAAAAVPIDRSLHYQWLNEDADYSKRFESARVQAGEVLLDEAVRRAYEGYEEPVVYQGGLCYAIDDYIVDKKTGKRTGKLKKNAKPLTITKFDSGLLHKLLDGFLPNLFKKRNAVEVTGANGGPIELSPEALKGLSNEELTLLIALAQKIAPAA